MPNFNERLSQLQNEKNFLKKDIAKSIGVTYRHYQRYENGEAEPTLNVIIKLANYFGVSIDYLVGRIQKDYLTLLEEAEDEYLLALALEREKNGSGIVYSLDEVMKRHGITQEDIDNAEEDELE
jgi:transcriptional regulator with XRE-family HTH domain